MSEDEDVCEDGDVSKDRNDESEDDDVCMRTVARVRGR